MGEPDSFAIVYLLVKMSVPPRPLLSDLYHSGSMIDLQNAPAALPHHHYYGNHHHLRSWRNPPVAAEELKKSSEYQARNSTGSHILDTYSRSRNLQDDLLHHRSLGFDYHVLPVAK